MSITRERIERDLLVAAELVDRYPDLLPYLERVEREYDALENRSSAVDRIRKKLGKVST